MVDPIIRIEGLKKRFPQFLLDVEFSLYPKELITIVGPSGCGKSTTLSLISGLLGPESGRIIIEGKDMTDVPVWKRNIGMVFQDYALFPHMNVKENISYGLKLRRTSEQEIDSRVSELLAVVGLSGYEKRRIDHLSGGERQRIALARAVAPNPSLLLLDEPLSALDAKLRNRLRKEIIRIHRELGLTTIYVTHDQQEALSSSDRIIVMNEGRIEQIGTPEEIYNAPKTMFTAQFIGTINKIPSDMAGYGAGTHICFRPEQVSILDTEPAGVSPEDQIFPEARLISREFTGGKYLCTFSFKDQLILAHADTAISRGASYQLRVKRNNFIKLD